MSVEKSLESISDKLDKVLRLLAINVVKDFEKDTEKIELLDSIGFRPAEIARFLNKSTENVTGTLSYLKKKKEDKKKALTSGQGEKDGRQTV